MISDTQRERRDAQDPAPVDDQGSAAAERAGGDGASSPGKDTSGREADEDDRPDTETGGAGGVSPAAGNTAGGRDR